MYYKAISFAVMREKQRRLYSSFTLHFNLLIFFYTTSKARRSTDLRKWKDHSCC